MKFGLYLLILSSISLQGWAADISLVINRFTKELFEDPGVSQDFRNYWTGSPDGSSARKDPNGGYLFRFELQFKESSDTLIFVATDRFGVGRESPSWAIYQERGSENWRQVAKSETFQYSALSVHHASRTIIQEFPPDRENPEEGKSYLFFKIYENGAVEKNRFLEGELTEGLRKMIDQSDRLISKIEKIPLAAYLHDPNTKWRPLGPFGMAAQSLDPEDAILLASMGDLEWTKATGLAKLLIVSSEEDSKPELQDQEEKREKREIESKQSLAMQVGLLLVGGLIVFGSLLVWSKKRE